eukprot:403353320
MDIERLNKLKQICFTKPSQNRKKQPFQSSKSPVNSNPQLRPNLENLNQNIMQKNGMLNNKNQKKDHLKEFEKEVSHKYEQKQKKLEENIKRFNESIKSKRLEKENQSQNRTLLGQNQRYNNAQSRTLSPVRLNDQSYFPEFKQRNMLLDIQNENISPIKRASSVNKYAGQNKQMQNYGLNRVNFREVSPFKSINSISLDFENQNQDHSFCGTSQFGLNNRLMPISSTQDYKISKIKGQLSQLLSIVSYPQNKPVISHQNIEQMRQKINGAFDKISRIPLTEQSKQLQNVVQGCLYDLSQRIQLFSQQKLTSQNLKVIQEMLHTTQEQSLNLDIEELCDRVVEFTITFKLQQGFERLEKIQRDKQLFQIKFTFGKFRRMQQVFQRQKLFLSTLVGKLSDKFKYQNQFKAFKQWKTETLNKEEATQMIVSKVYQEIMLQNQQGSYSYKIFNKQLEAFVMKTITTASKLNKTSSFIDPIYVNNLLQPYFYKIIDGDDQNEQIQEFPENYNILQDMIQSKSSKSKFIENIMDTKTFNSQFDIPFTQNSTSFLKDTNRLSQLYIPIYKSNSFNGLNKKQIMIVRVSFRNLSLQDYQKLIPSLKMISSMIQPLISQSLQAFKKIKKLYDLSKTGQPSAQSNDQSFLTSKEFNLLQYLHGKTLELSSIRNISECFKLSQTIVKELFNYDKVQILQYNCGKIEKLYDQSKPNQVALGYLQDEKSSQEIGYIIQNMITTENSEKINERILQKIVKDQDKFEMSREIIKDQVLIHLPSNLKYLAPQNQQQIDYQYFLRLEKKLEKEKSQELFIDKFCQSQQIHKTFTSLIRAIISKMKQLELQVSSQLIPNIQDSRFNELEMTKINQINEDLKMQLDISKATDIFIEELKHLDIFQNFDILQQKLGDLIIDKIPQAVKTQLFLSKDDNADIFYTYVLDKNPRSKSQQQRVLNENHNLENIMGNTMKQNINQRFQKVDAIDQSNLPKIQINNKNLIDHQQNLQNTQMSHRQSETDTNSQAVHQLISYRQQNEQNHVEILRIKSHQQARPQSQINQAPQNTFVQSNDHAIHHQHQLTTHQQLLLQHQLDDISSISAGDAHTNPNEKNSFMINTFIGADTQDPVIVQLCHQRQPSLTRQPSLNLFGATSSSTNLRNQIHLLNNINPNLQNHHNQQYSMLKRDKSAQSELHTLPQQIQIENSNLQFQQQNVQEPINFINIKDYQQEINVKMQGINKPPLTPIYTQFQQNQSKLNKTQQTQQEFLLTSNFILENTISANEEIDIQIGCLNPAMKLIEFPIYNNKDTVKSIISFAIDQKEPLIKRNLKNDRRFNMFIDNLINHDEEKRGTVSENSIIIPMIYGIDNKCIGVIQVSNNDKQSIFTELDVSVLQLISDKLTKFLVDYKEQFGTKVLFKKQMEVSMLHSYLENQSVTKILRMANNLFLKSQSKPIKSVYKFISKCEDYLQNVFNCKYAQILCVSHETQDVLSFQAKVLVNQEIENSKPITKVRLIKRCHLNENSIATSLIKNQLNDPVIWPLPQNDYILIGDDDISEKEPKQVMGSVSYQLLTQRQFKASIDAPQNSGIEYCPQTYLAICIRDQQDRVLAVVQLMQRLNGFKFTEQDIKHLGMISDHLSQIFIHIETQNYLQQFSQDKLKGIEIVSKVLNRQVKHHYKGLFRELLAFKYGQQNLLKNKIMRKFLDRHLKVDNILIQRIQKLVEMRKKYDEQNKSQAFIKLRQKIKYLTEKRQKNGQKCVQILTKYDKLLKIRVKDTVFKFWEQFKKQDFSEITHFGPKGDSQNSSFDVNNFQSQILNSRQAPQHTNPNLYSTFNLVQDQSSYFSGENFVNQSSILDESSLTSIIYLKAKAVYKFRKFFNQNFLRVMFNTLKIKLFSDLPTKKINNLFFNEDTLKLLKMHRILSKNYHTLRVKFFNAFVNHNNHKQRRDKSLKQLLDKKYKKFVSFGIKTWQTQTENSIRNDLKQEKSYVSLLTEQCKEGTILQMMIIGINQAFQSSNYQSIDECLNSIEIKQLFMNLCENIQSQTLQPYSMVLTFKLPENYHTSGSQYAMFVYPSQEIEFSRTAFNQQLSHLSSINEISRAEKMPNHFSSISEIGGNNIATGTNGQLDGLNNNFNQNLITENSQPMFYCADFSNDAIFNLLNKSKQILQLNDLQQNYSMTNSLKLRAMSSQNAAYIIPMLIKVPLSQTLNKPIQPYTNQEQTKSTLQNCQYTLFGTIEIYQKNSFDCSQKEAINQPQFSLEDQIRFKQYASVVQLGIETFSQKLFNVQENYNIQLQRELLEIEKQRELDICKNNSLSHVVNYLSQKIMDTFNADHCLMIFISPTGRKENMGTFYNFEDNKLYQIDFTGTFFENILKSKNEQNCSDMSPSQISSQSFNNQPLRQVTFPSKLVCKDLNKNQSSPILQQTMTEEQFETLTGQSYYEALKYIPIENTTSSNQMLIFLEIGWSKYSAAQQLHDNDFYMQKKESLIREKILEHIQLVCQNIKFFIQTMKLKVNQVNSKVRLRDAFDNWRRQSIILQNAFTSTKKELLTKFSPDLYLNQRPQRHNPYCTDTRKLSFQNKSQSPQNTLGRISRDNSPQLSNLYFNQSNYSIKDPSAQKSIQQQFMQNSTQKNINHQSSDFKRDTSPHNYHSRRISYNNQSQYHQQPIQEIENESEFFSELEVEKAAKRKLVSTSLLFISLLSRTMRLQKIRESFKLWSSYTQNAVIAERAFNQILEINHRHSKVRFESSINIIERLFKREELRSVMMALRGNIDHSNTEHITGSKMNPLISYQNKPNHNRIRSQDQHLHRRKQHLEKIQESSLILRGIDTQSFEDEVFTIQELDQSLVNELNIVNYHQKSNLHHNDNNLNHFKKGANHISFAAQNELMNDRTQNPQGLNMIIVDNDYKAQTQTNSKAHSRQLSSHQQSSSQDNYSNQVTNDNKNEGFNNGNMMGTINDIESEFSLGQGTKNMIKFKADSILEQARNEFNSKNSAAFNMRR